MNNMKFEGICDVQMSTMAKQAPRRVCRYVIYFGVKRGDYVLVDLSGSLIFHKFTVLS